MRVSVKVLALALVATLVAPVLPASPVQAAPGGPAVVVTGRGNGHGRGLSQYGAYGWAVASGWTWQQIVSFYYPGSTPAPLADPEQVMTVHLSAMNDLPTSVVADAGNAILVQDPVPGRTWTSLVAREIAPRTYRVWGSTERRCSLGDPAADGFVLVADVQDAASFTTTAGADPASPAEAQIGLCEPTAGRVRVRYYRGEVRAVNNARGENRTINAVRMEGYLRGVVPREAPSSWGAAGNGAGMHALRAQAVAARSYAATENRYAGLARTCDTESCQVYGGAMLRESINAPATVLEAAPTDAAIAETYGIAMIAPNGSPVRTEFTSSNGGRTAGGAFPAQADAGDLASDAANPLLTWTRVLTAQQIAAKYPQIGSFTGIETSHDGLGGDWGGYTTTVRISGTAGSASVSGWAFRGAFDLPAPWFAARPVAGADPGAPPTGPMLFIGDSVGESIAAEFAAIVAPAYPGIDYRAKANRCMVGSTCILADAPDALTIVNSIDPANAPKVAIIQLGYNDDPGSFAGEVDQVVAALNARGTNRIVFVNLSVRRSDRFFAVSNAVLASAAQRYPNVSVLDWNAASIAPSQGRWFRDGVHLTSTGRVEFALFLRQQLDALRAAGAFGPRAVVAAGMAVPLVRGNRGPFVAELQRALNAYLALPKSRRLRADGVLGKGTVRAISEAEARAGLPVDGAADAALLQAVGVNPAGFVLRRGSRHESVAAAQTALYRVLGVAATPDGAFGPGTERLVRRFQQQAGLPVTGRIDAATWQALAAAGAG